MGEGSDYICIYGQLGAYWTCVSHAGICQLPSYSSTDLGQLPRLATSFLGASIHRSWKLQEFFRNLEVCSTRIPYYRSIIFANSIVNFSFKLNAELLIYIYI